MKILISNEKDCKIQENLKVIKVCIDYINSLNNYPEKVNIDNDPELKIEDICIENENKEIYNLKEDTEKIFYKLLFPGDEYDIEKLKLCNTLVKSVKENLSSIDNMVSSGLLSTDDINNIDKVINQKFLESLLSLVNTEVKKMKKEVKSPAVIIDDLTYLTLLRHSNVLQDKKNIEFIIAPYNTSEDKALYTVYDFYNTNKNTSFIISVLCAFEHIGHSKNNNLTFFFDKEDIRKILSLLKKINSGKFTVKINGDLSIGDLKITPNGLLMTTEDKN